MDIIHTLRAWGRNLARFLRFPRPDPGSTMAAGEGDQLHRDLYEEVPVAITFVNTEGIIRTANQQAAEFFGRPLEELAGCAAMDEPRGQT